MPWRVIFTGAIALLLAVMVGALAILVRAEYPWLSAVSVIADLGIILGGLKTVLDTTKTANELRKMGLEVDKLKLEITEKKKAAEKEDSRIVVATLAEIETYTRRINPDVLRRASSRGFYIYGGTAIAIVVCGLLAASAFMSKVDYSAHNTEESSHNNERLPSPTAGKASSPSMPSANPSNPQSLKGQAKKEQEIAAFLANRAEQEYRAGDYCQALATLNEAVAIYPEPRWIHLKPTYEHGCDSQ